MWFPTPLTSLSTTLSSPHLGPSRWDLPNVPGPVRREEERLSEKAEGRERAYPVLSWSHTGRLHTSQCGPVGQGRATVPP